MIMKNWKTTVSGIGTACMAALAAISAAPAELGEASTVLPPEWKAPIFKASILAAFILRVIHSCVAQDAKKEEPKLP